MWEHSWIHWALARRMPESASLALVAWREYRMGNPQPRELNKRSIEWGDSPEHLCLTLHGQALAHTFGWRARESGIVCTLNHIILFDLLLKKCCLRCSE